MNYLDPQKIKSSIAVFEETHDRLSRDASFDYCFNYFQNFTDKKQLVKSNVQLSCLHLHSYLASWGMLRNSFLMKKSIKFFEPLIEYFASDECDVWGIDVNAYDEENIGKLIACYRKIKNILLRDEEKPRKMVTLVTKIMLGVFGNVPALDSYFRKASGWSTFNKRSLVEIGEFYNSKSYPELISNEAAKIRTFDYESGNHSDRSYTRAKIIDTLFFMEGFNNSRQKP